MKRTTSPSSAAPAVDTLAELGERVGEIRKRRGEVLSQILALEKSGTVGRLDDAPRSKRAAAVDLLNGSVAAFMDTLEGGPERLRALRIEIGVIDEALAIADQLSRSLKIKEAGERFDARRKDWLAAMRKVALTLIELEHALEDRDALSREIKYIAPLSGEGWPLVGRLANSGSQIYRFLQIAVVEGWIDQKEFLNELDDARK